MRTQNIMRHFAWGVLGLVTQQAYSQASQPDNNGGAGSFVGWNAGANQILDVKNEGDQPIDFYTSDLFRARINPKMSYAIGTAPTDARNGFMLLSGRDNFPQQVSNVFKTNADGHLNSYWRMFHGEDEFGQLFHLRGEKQFNINAPLGHLL